MGRILTLQLFSPQGSTVSSDYFVRHLKCFQTGNVTPEICWEAFHALTLFALSNEQNLESNMILNNVKGRITQPHSQLFKIHTLLLQIQCFVTVLGRSRCCNNMSVRVMQGTEEHLNARCDAVLIVRERLCLSVRFCVLHNGILDKWLWVQWEIFQVIVVKE